MNDRNFQAYDARLRAAKLYESTKAPPRLRSVPPPLPWQRVANGSALLAPAELERFGDLLLFARATVEGFFAGKHKSPFRGSSVEFTDYKEYVPGDEPKRIDWQCYGRSRRLFVRQFEAETDMAVYLLVDVSASMKYAGTARQSKYIIAAKVAAALAYLMIGQGDKTGLTLFAQGLRGVIPPGGTRQHLHKMVSVLESVQPSATTGIANALADCDAMMKRRGLIVLLSDFWDDTDQTFDALSRFLHRKFQILLLHVAHPDELDLPAVQAARFRDMETNGEVAVETEEVRAAYRELARQRIERLAREANLRRMDYALVNTERPYWEALEAYLGFRGRNTLASR